MKEQCKYRQRKAALYNERSSWIEHWRDVSKVLLPRNGRFMLSDRNKGDKVHNNIYDSTGTKALRTLAAGMMSGMTSPARPWFRLATSDTNLMEYGPVKVWLDHVTGVMREVFARSNTYRALHAMYEELGAFGTGAALVLPDFNDVIRLTPLTVGEYAVAADERGEISTLYREFDMNVAQIVAEFGIENVSQTVKNLWDTGKNLDSWVTIIHAIEPRKDRDSSKRDSKNMPWASVYFEAGGHEDKTLREGGFKHFPAIVPRWNTVGGDVYGHGPGMEALGDIKQLQHEQLRKANGIDYMTKPPLQAPHSMKGQDTNLLPGGVSYVDMAGPNAGMRPAFEARIDLSHLLQDIQDVRGRVSSIFYADLFLMMQGDDRSGTTAREISERHEEKMLMLGPVLERLHNELLNPLIDLTFDYMMEAKIVAPPPPELEGNALNVEFVSVLAQAQRAVGISAIESTAMFVGQLAAAKQDPSVWDKINTDQMIDDYAEGRGLNPSAVVSDEDANKVRDQRAKQQQQMQAMQTMQQGAATAKDVSQINTGGGQNMMSDLLNQFQGYSIPVAQ